jgi:hypothetical protein
MAASLLIPARSAAASENDELLRHDYMDEALMTRPFLPQIDTIVIDPNDHNTPRRHGDLNFGPSMGSQDSEVN